MGRGRTGDRSERLPALFNGGTGPPDLRRTRTDAQDTERLAMAMGWGENLGQWAEVHGTPPD